MQFSQSTWKFAWQRFIAEVIIGLLFPSLFWKGGSPWHIAYHLLTSLFSIPPPIKSLYRKDLYDLIFYSLFFDMSAICTEFYMSIPVPNVSFCTIRFLHYIVQSFIPIATVQQIISFITHYFQGGILMNTYKLVVQTIQNGKITGNASLSVSANSTMEARQKFMMLHPPTATKKYKIIACAKQ